MKLYLLLIISSLIMALTSGYYALFNQMNHASTSQDILEITRHKLDFVRLVDPIGTINFNEIYYSPNHLELINPRYIINKLPFNSVDYSSNKRCFEDLTIIDQEDIYQKALLWEEYRCGRRELISSFFLAPPFLHPSGHSYAYLAFSTKKSPYNKPSWIKNNLSLFHLLELPSVRHFIGDLKGDFKLLSQFDRRVLNSIGSEKGTILTKKFLLARLVYNSLPSIIEYRVYDRKDLNEFLMSTPYTLHNYRSGQNCFYHDGELCWDYSSRHIFKQLNKTTLFFFLFSLFIICLVCSLLFFKIKEQKRENERKRLILKILGHEFRTPITSMLLSLENIRRDFDKIPSKCQEQYLRISGDVYRLKSLTDKSQSYLRAQSDKNLFQKSIVKLSSINEFVKQQIESFGEQCNFVPLKKDKQVNTDTYWLNICIKNICENAFAHGKPPLKVELTALKDSIQISFQDQGNCHFATIEQMTYEFSKGNSSNGTGLGLNIVKKVIEEMEGKLTFLANPTRFVLTIKDFA